MKAITDRRSIRKYKNIPLEEEKIKDILRAALLAPSAKNRQPWKFIVYQGETQRAAGENMEKGMERRKKGITDLPGFAYGLPDATHTLEIMRSCSGAGGSFKYQWWDVLCRGDRGRNREIVESCDSLSIRGNSRKYAVTCHGAGSRLSVDRQYLLCL